MSISTIDYSLIIPTRNRSELLFKCLTSIQEFRYLDRPEIEVIIVDNNSNDNATQQVCRGFAVKYIFEPSQGRAAAINAGARASTGRLLAFTDDDTIMASGDWLDTLASNFDRPEVGYVSGNVKAYQLENPIQKMWENKGGLSKGPEPREFNTSYFKRFRFSGVPIRLMAAGANSMIRREVWDEVGGHDELFGVGALVNHGESLEICYKILHYGYTAIYDPTAIVFHQHPTTKQDLIRKQYFYGIGDTAVHTHFFFEYRDIRSLFEALISRQWQICGRLIRSLLKKHPFTPDILLAQILGNAIGPFVYLRARLHQNYRLISVLKSVEE